MQGSAGPRHAAVCPAVCSGPWCALARDRGALACARGLVVVCVICVYAGLITAASVLRVLRPLVPAWSTFPSCRHWSTLCARLCVRGRGVCLQGNAGPCHAPALCCCVCGLCSCSLYNNGIGDAGAAALGAWLVHLPRLQTLKRCTPGCVYGAVVFSCKGARGHGMRLRCAVLLCARFVFVQP